MKGRGTLGVAFAALLALQPAWAFDADTLAVPSQEARSLVFAPDGKGVYIADPDGNIRLWDLSSGEMAVIAKSGLTEGGSASRHLVRLTEDGTHALSAYDSGEIRYVDLASGDEVWKVRLFTEQLLALALSPDGKLGAASDLSGRLVLFKVEDGAVIWEVNDNGIVSDLAFSASGKHFFEAETIRFRARRLDGPVADLDFDVPGPGAAVFEDIDVAKTGTVAAAKFSEVHLYDGDSGKRLRVVEIDGRLSANIVALSQDGRRFLTKLDNGQAGLFDARTGKPLGAVGEGGELKDLEALAFSPDGSRFVTADNDGQIALWRTKGLKQVATAMIWSGGYVVFLPDGAFMTGAEGIGLPVVDGFDPSTADPAKVKAAFAK